MRPDHPTTGEDDGSAVARAAAAAAAGFGGRISPTEAARLAALVAADPDPTVRAAALGALTRCAPRRTALVAWSAAASDVSASVRRRATEVAPTLAARSTRRLLMALLADPDALVAEGAAWALGEVGPPSRESIAALSKTATGHADPLVRESAVAALGALGDPAGLPAVLAGCRDRPAVRRRAVIALAPFDGAEVEQALLEALDDPDWQVRQAAEDLLR